MVLCVFFVFSAIKHCAAAPEITLHLFLALFAVPAAAEN